MRHLRVWLMLLLIFLLPVRGAMAAAMLCLPQDRPQSQKVMAQHLGEGATHDRAQHDHAQHDHGQHVQGHHAEADGRQVVQDSGLAPVMADDCNLCASSCSLTPLAPTTPDLRHPPARAALNATFTGPAPSFVPDGEDRPPGTI